MLADFFTKPLQGVLFKKFREVILGNKHLDSLDLDPMLLDPKEHVGSEQANGHRTDGPDDNGFILEKEKKRRKTGMVSWADVDTLQQEQEVKRCNKSMIRVF